MTELKPCPFCGGNARMLRHELGIMGRSGYDWWHAIQCQRCNAAVGYDDNRYRDKSDAIRAWNTRAPSPELTAANERIKVLEEGIHKALLECGTHFDQAKKKPLQESLAKSKEME